MRDPSFPSQSLISLMRAPSFLHFPHEGSLISLTIPHEGSLNPSFREMGSLVTTTIYEMISTHFTNFIDLEGLRRDWGDFGGLR